MYWGFGAIRGVCNYLKPSIVREFKVKSFRHLIELPNHQTPYKYLVLSIAFQLALKAYTLSPDHLRLNTTSYPHIHCDTSIHPSHPSITHCDVFILELKLRLTSLICIDLSAILSFGVYCYAVNCSFMNQ